MFKRAVNRVAHCAGSGQVPTRVPATLFMPSVRALSERHVDLRTASSALHQVHALFDIPAGTELSICYLAPRGMERAVRRALLLEDHGFECHCPKCELSGEALALSESRQRAIGEFLRPAESRLPVVQLHQRLQLRLQFMRDEGLPPLWAWKPVLFPLMSASMTELMRAPADQVSRRRVVDWAARASKAVRCGLGDDHPAAEFLAQFIAST